MSSRNERLFLEDMLTGCDKVRLYTAGLSRTDFSADTMVYDATLRNIEIIGEACKQISPAIREQYPNIPWRKISGMRDIVVHHYFGIDGDVIWDVVVNQIPNLREQLVAIIASIDEGQKRTGQ